MSAEPGRSPRPGVWRLLVPVVCLAAGIGFAASARDAGGTQLRAPGITTLADTVRAAEHRVQDAATIAAGLQSRVESLTRDAASGDAAVARAQSRVTALSPAGGLGAVAGPGLEVVLDDASATGANAGADPNQLVIHQSDLQSVVNALWAGGAEAMSIAGRRVTATSAVRCVGPTLLLDGLVFSPPYDIQVIGPAQAMQDSLAASPGVRFFVEAADYYGLGYTVVARSALRIPAFTDPVELRYAHVLHR